MTANYTPDDIQSRALATWYKREHAWHYALTPSTLGLVGEAGEFADVVKKILYKPSYTKDSGKQAGLLREELGDVLFYLAILSHQLGITLDDLSRMNYDKLQQREKNEEGYTCG